MANLSSFISNGALRSVSSTLVSDQQRVASKNSVSAAVQADLKKAGMETTSSTDDGTTFRTTIGGKEVNVVDGVTQTAGMRDDFAEEIVVTGREKKKPISVSNSRLRLSALAGGDNELRVYGPNNAKKNIMAPLFATGGLMFPYTPSIQISGEANWTTHDLVHTNFDILSYERTPSATIGITGKFTVQNQREGAYALAVIHFLRTMTKMHYGDQQSRQDNAKENAGKPAIAGLPPPVLRLRGYGTYMFPDLRCVLKSYSYNFDDNMDLIPIDLPSGGNVLLPPMFSISIGIGLQQSPTRVRNNFNLDEFRTGQSMNSKGNWF